MENYKYSLSKKGKHICPMCEHKTFVLYIDNETGQPLNENVGKCDRSGNCAHHYTPKQYFADNNISFDTKKEYTPIQKPTPKPQPLPSFIDNDIFKQSLRRYENNNFVKYLHGFFGTEVATKAIERYFVGTSKRGGAVFWQIDLQRKIRTGKDMLYKIDGNRNKDIPYSVLFVHKNPELKLSNFNLSQCFFGEHLLHDTTKIICIVESEKTAIIASIYFPNMIWLASGGSEGLNINKCRCLKGRTVILYPDAKTPDKDGKTLFDKWSEKAKELSTICKITVFDLIEKNATDAERAAGYDLADYLIKTPFSAQTKTPQPTTIEMPQSIIKRTTTHETGQKRQLNDEVCCHKKETVNFENEINELADFFSSITLPETPVKLNQCTTINDTRFFVESSLKCLRANYNNAAFLPYLENLKEFRDYFKK